MSTVIKDSWEFLLFFLFSSSVEESDVASGDSSSELSQQEGDDKQTEIQSNTIQPTYTGISLHSVCRPPWWPLLF